MGPVGRRHLLRSEHRQSNLGSAWRVFPNVNSHNAPKSMESQDRDGYTVEGIRDLIRFKLLLISFAWTGGAGAGPKLPAGPSKAIVQRVCTACHAADVFAGKAHTR